MQRALEAARTQAEEQRCPDIEMNVLWTIEDVTDRVKSAATAEMLIDSAVFPRP